MTGPVTALGIRDGDPDVLRALIARRGSAVLAYCERACPAAQVADAAAEAFARFRALVVAAPRPADLDPEAALLSSTRHSAAERAPRGQAPPAGAGLGKLLGGRPTADQITLVPELLIARADGTLDAEGEEQLNRLLDASAAARAAEERFRTAEHAYRSAPPRPIPEEIVDHIIEAMSGVPAPQAKEPVGVEAGGAAMPPPPPPAAPPSAPDEPPPDDLPPHAEAAPEEEPPEAEPADEPPPDELPPDELPPDELPPRAEAAREEEPLEDDELEDEPLDDEAEEEPLEDEPLDDEPLPGEAVEASARAAVAPDPVEDFEEEDEMEDAGTEEWSVPPEELAEEGALDVEIAAARLREPDEDDEEDEEEDEPARIQTASGAVDEPLAAAAPPRARAAPTPPPREPRPKGGVPGKGALAPAAAVVAVAAVSILATSGVLGGDESSPPVDTGVAPKSSQVEVPEGEAAAVIDDLRRAADDARRQRLADQRGSVPADPAPEEEAPAPTPEPEAQAEPAPEEQPQEEAPTENDGANSEVDPAPDEDTGDGTPPEGEAAP